MRKGEVEKESWRGWTRARVSEPFPKLEEQGDFGFLYTLVSLPLLSFPFPSYDSCWLSVAFSFRSDPRNLPTWEDTTLRNQPARTDRRDHGISVGRKGYWIGHACSCCTCEGIQEMR